MAVSMRIKEIAKQQFLLKKNNVIAKATKEAKQKQYENIFGFNNCLKNTRNELHI